MLTHYKINKVLDDSKTEEIRNCFPVFYDTGQQQQQKVLPPLSRLRVKDSNNDLDFKVK